MQVTSTTQYTGNGFDIRAEVGSAGATKVAPTFDPAKLMTVEAIDALATDLKAVVKALKAEAKKSLPKPPRKAKAKAESAA